MFSLHFLQEFWPVSNILQAERDWYCLRLKDLHLFIKSRFVLIFFLFCKNFGLFPRQLILICNLRHKEEFRFKIGSPRAVWNE